MFLPGTSHVSDILPSWFSWPMNMSTQSRPTNSFKLQNNLKYSFLVKIPLSSETFAFTADHVNKRIKQGFSVHRYILYYIQYILYVLYYYIMETNKKSDLAKLFPREIHHQKCCENHATPKCKIWPFINLKLANPLSPKHKQRWRDKLRTQI